MARGPPQLRTPSNTAWCDDRDGSSYSFGNIALANLDNAVHSVYVFNLPPGPIWVLHSFYLASSALMLYADRWR